jgi:dienelactone hydrolase
MAAPFRASRKETIEKRQAACKAAGKTWEFAVYPNAAQGFNADYRPSYRADAAKGRPDENAGLVQASRGRIGAGSPPGLLVA